MASKIITLNSEDESTLRFILNELLDKLKEQDIENVLVRDNIRALNHIIQTLNNENNYDNTLKTFKEKLKSKQKRINHMINKKHVVTTKQIPPDKKLSFCITSRIVQFVNSRGFRVSYGLAETLDKCVAQLLLDAEQRAKINERKTIRNYDI